MRGSRQRFNMQCLPRRFDNPTTLFTVGSGFQLGTERIAFSITTIPDIETFLHTLYLSAWDPYCKLGLEHHIKGLGLSLGLSDLTIGGSHDFK